MEIRRIMELVYRYIENKMKEKVKINTTLSNLIENAIGDVDPEDNNTFSTPIGLRVNASNILMDIVYDPNRDMGIINGNIPYIKLDISDAIQKITNHLDQRLYDSENPEIEKNSSYFVKSHEDAVRDMETSREETSGREPAEE